MISESRIGAAACQTTTVQGSGPPRRREADRRASSSSTGPKRRTATCRGGGGRIEGKTHRAAAARTTPPTRAASSLSLLCRRFLVSLACISVVLNKIVLLLQSTLDRLRPATYFWLPSVFGLDALFVVLVGCGLLLRPGDADTTDAPARRGAPGRRWWWCCSCSCCCGWFRLAATSAAVLVTFLAASTNVAAVLGHGRSVPWALAAWALLTEWSDLELLVRAKAEEAHHVRVWMVALVQCVWALLSAVCYSYCAKRSSNSMPPAIAATLPLQVGMRRISSPCSGAPRWRRHPRGTALPVLLLLLVVAAYLLLAVRLRPHTPYDQLTQTPCFSVPLEIWEGIKQYREHKHMATAVDRGNQQQQQQFGNDRRPPIRQKVSESFKPLNVVLVFLESTRADMMPFDRSTPWADRFVSANHDDVTPFYSRWTRLNDETLHIPLIKSASGFTHKSLPSALCSVHTLPVQGTIEPSFEFYHPCLPHRLDGLNYSSVFFQPSVENWEHERELVHRMGFPAYFGKESYNNRTGASEDFQRRHTVNYFGYEDSVMLPMITEWIDQQRTPFFLSYLSGISHDPYSIPPSINWTTRFFSENTKVNDYLNTVSYMDRWLEQLMGELDARHLLESTLVVVLGDHGVTIYERNRDQFTTFDMKYEEAMDVGISFHSRSERWKSILRELDAAAIANGTHSSIDVLPTILEILGIGGRGNDDDNNSSSSSSSSNNDLVDGRSMLHPSGQRLRLSIANPGYTMVLRDRTYVLVHRLSDAPEAFDLRVDPEQANPVLIDGSAKGELAQWGEKADSFLRFVEEDLHWSYQRGQRCSNCTLSLLLTLQSLDDWSPEMGTRRYPQLFEMTDDYPEWFSEEEPPPDLYR